MKKIIVGLGNPGKEFEDTYHNAGVLALERLMRDEPGVKGYEKVALKKNKRLFDFFEADQMVFIRPRTYMNESGGAVREALKKFNAKPKDLIVLHDDSDIALGECKISFARSSAGHKGVQSIIDALKTNAFTRGRIGIRSRKELDGKTRRQKAGEFALKKITTVNRKTLDAVFKEMCLALMVNERDRE